MFTGIVAAVGRIEWVTPLFDTIAAKSTATASTVSPAERSSASPNAAALTGVDSGLRLHIDAAGLDLSDVAIGDSIAIQGACMTVIALDGSQFTVEISRESLNKTVGLDRPGEVNLEKALRLADRLGGHLVAGHVDGLGEVVRFEPVGESHLLMVRADRTIGRYLAYKGSITVNGVSLTVNRVADDASGSEFSSNLIAHTVAVTTLRHLRVGARVNLEVDLIARYVERMHAMGPA